MSTMDDTLGTVMKLATAAEALAGLVARLRADVEGIELDPDVAAGLDAVVKQLGVDVTALSPEERGRVAMSARALLAQAADLATDPGRAPGWAFEDPIVLMSTGRLSANIANVIAQIAPSLDGLQAALERDGATFLDVGAGVAALSIALCETWPGLRVVGLEPWAAAMALAEAQVAASDVGDRVELRAVRVEDLPAGEAFDVAWLAGPFVPAAVIPTALASIHAALRPGGWLLFGRFAGPPEPLADAVTRLRVVRSGGTVAGAEEVGLLMDAAGLVDVREVPRTWHAPVGFIAGRRPA
jgi:SAM-dependent methyltransferase